MCLRKFTRRQLLAGALATAAPGARLNIIQVLIDDMGYADLGCYGGEAATPNLDRLAGEGIRFTQGCVASPVCSPSRVAITTGQFPSRHFIYSYLDTREAQHRHRMHNWLDVNAPSVARTFQQAGYATAHFGKWHMGGGRDVGDAPLPSEYGFDETYTSFEGLGDRALPPGRLSDQNEKLGRGDIVRVEQRDLTRIYVDRTVAFMKQAAAAAKPFYIHLWLNEVHDPFDPQPDVMRKYERHSGQKYIQQYFATIEDMDRQLGRVFKAVDELGLGGQTLIVVLSDNGPTAWPRYYKEKLEAPGSTGGLRGRKWSLYEGGIRVPFIARWKGRIPTGRIDEESVVCSVDLFPTCCKLAGIAPPNVSFDGEDRSRVFLGEAAPRKKDLFWDYGRDPDYQKPGLPHDQSPNLALRSGNWKVLVNDDGSNLELYDLARDRAESNNLSAARKDVAGRLSRRLLDWRHSLPVLPEKA
jgi:arylsulfatase A-like enzyme